MRNWLTERLQIKSGEGLVTVLMFLYIFGVLTFYYILKPLRSGLFLKNFPPSHLPYAYFLTAFLAGTLATLVFKVSRRISTITFLTVTNLVIIATLLYFRWAMGREIFYLPYFYFVYVQIVSVLSTAQFWLLAGYIYDNRQSKRIFPLLGAGAIAGAMAGSFVPGFLSQILSTQSMLLICILVCAVLILISQSIWRYRRSDSESSTASRKFEESSERFTDLLRMVFGSKHLLLVIVLVFLTLIASQISDWQVNSAADTAFGELSSDEKERSINELFGRFYFSVNIVGILLQLTLTGFILRRFGIGAAILFLPLGLFFSALGVMIHPVLWTTALNLGSNSVFRYSIHRVGLELLYLPISPEFRKKIKVFIDVFIDRFGRAIAGLIILALTSAYFPIGLRGTSTTIFILSGVCVVVSLYLRRSYVEAFRQKLARREVDLAEISRYVTDPSSIALLTDALESKQERQILYALQLLQASRGIDFSKQLLPLLSNSSPFVRREAVLTLSSLPGKYRAKAEEMLTDSSNGVRTAAVEYLCSLEPTQREERIGVLLNHEDLNVRLSAAQCAAGQTDPPFKPTMDLVNSFLETKGEKSIQARSVAAQLAARLPSDESIRLLRKLIHDTQPEVANAAAKAAGVAGHLDLVFEILPMLSRKTLRTGAREGLVLYGPRISGTLGDVLADPQHELSLRREIPWILSQYQSSRAADVLAENLSGEDALLKYQVVKALNRIHERNPDMALPKPMIAERVFKETEAYYQAFVLSQSVSLDRENAKSLLQTALRERLDKNLEIIFRLLGLQYPQKDIYSAYTALKGGRSDRRVSAIEFLDNVLQKNLKSMILPLLEESSAERLVDFASRLFGISTNGRKEALRLILQQRDVWLKACALHEIGTNRISDLKEICETFLNDSEPILRETAEWALKRCA